MIGMNQIKKRLLYGILIGLAVGVVGIVVMLIITSNIISSYEEGTNKNFLKNYTARVVTFTQDVIQGQTITSDMVTTTVVHKETLPADAITSISSVVGMVAKYNIPSHITIVSSMLSDSVIASDVRIQEVSAVLLPTKLTVGEFIDIRLMVPSGIEYIVLPQKQVLDISGTTIWLELSEEELLTLNGAIVDSYMTEGSKLYAVQYADPTTQIKIDDAASKQARLHIQNKIREEVSEIIGTIDNGRTDVGEDVDTEETPNTTVDAAVASKLVEMMTAYAIEYRYYVESYSKVESNYQPNTYIIEYMNNNEYIVELAKERLSLEARLSIEESISSFEATNTEGDYNSIVSGVDASKATQQSLRNSVLGD